MPGAAPDLEHDSAVRGAGRSAQCGCDAGQSAVAEAPVVVGCHPVVLDAGRHHLRPSSSSSVTLSTCSSHRGNVAIVAATLSAVLACASGLSDAVAAELSPKSTELVDHRCVGELAEDDLTLFANGTVRLRERVGERENMLLAELERSEVDGFVARLLDVDLSEAESLRSGITGEWISQCGLTLSLPDRPAEFFRYGRFDVLPYSLETVRAVLTELETLARTRAVHGDAARGLRAEAG